MEASSPWESGPRFEGGRFEQSGLPIAVLRELQVYCELVVKAAKAIFLQKNPHYRRVPKGFEGRFLPRLMSIEDGSVRPMIERRSSDLFMRHGDDEFDLAARYMGDIVTSVRDDDVSSAVMKLPNFDIGETARLGKTLLPSERMVLLDSSGHVAILDAEVRQLLEDYSQQASVSRARLVGRVTRVDAEKRQFTVWSEESQRHCRGPFNHSSELLLLRRVLTEDRQSGPSVELQGSIRYDSKNSPSGWNELYSLAEISSDQTKQFYKLEDQLMNLDRLQDGWLDDDSRSPTQNAIRTASDIADLLKSRSLPAPTAFPTPDGGISLEWMSGVIQIGVTILASGSEGELSFWNEDTGGDSLEHTHELNADTVVTYVRRAIGESKN